MLNQDFPGSSTPPTSWDLGFLPGVSILSHMAFSALGSCPSPAVFLILFLLCNLISLSLPVLKHLFSFLNLVTVAQQHPFLEKRGTFMRIFVLPLLASPYMQILVPIHPVLIPVDPVSFLQSGAKTNVGRDWSKVEVIIAYLRFLKLV